MAVNHRTPYTNTHTYTGDTCRISYSNSAKGAKCRSKPPIPPVPAVAVVLVNVAVAVAVVTTAKKALTRIGKNWVKEEEKKCGCRTNWSVCVCVCVAHKTIIRPRLRKGKRVERVPRQVRAEQQQQIQIEGRGE